MITSLIAKCDLLGGINLIPPSELPIGYPLIINWLAGRGVAGELHEADTSSRRRLIEAKITQRKTYKKDRFTENIFC